MKCFICFIWGAVALAFLLALDIRGFGWCESYKKEDRKGHA